jgi:hypothetical protein
VLYVPPYPLPPLIYAPYSSLEPPQAAVVAKKKCKKENYQQSMTAVSARDSEEGRRSQRNLRGLRQDEEEEGRASKVREAPAVQTEGIPPHHHRDLRVLAGPWLPIGEWALSGEGDGLLDVSFAVRSNL